MDIQFKIENGMNGLPAVCGYFEESKIGFLEVANEGCGIYRIEKTEIYAEYRGQGLYKQFLSAAFELIAMDALRSHERNMHSNWAYIKWTGCEDLDPATTVWIQKSGGKLEFTID